MLMNCVYYSSSLLSELSSVAQAIVAVANFIFVIVVLKYQIKKDKQDKDFQTDRIRESFNLENYRTIFINSRLDSLYSFFDETLKELETHNGSILTSETEKAINRHFNNFEFNFVATFSALDNSDIYEKIEIKLDNLRDKIFSQNTINFYSLRYTVIDTRNGILKDIIQID